MYHDQAVEKLRKYVRLLGNSLSQKDSTAHSESVKAYRSFAEQQYCEPDTLIPRKEQNQVRTGLDRRR
jgi:hypothetical protein